MEGDFYYFRITLSTITAKPLAQPKFNGKLFYGNKIV
jgi:hypothetical protein